MKLLIAEDDVLFQKMLSQVLAPDYEIVLACTGDEAWDILQRPDAPRLAVLDWVMPGLSGPEICRKVRACERLKSMYLIIVTSKNNEADIVSGLRAGADDYITKPPITAELRARIRVGERVLSLQAAVESQFSTGASLFAGEDLAREPLARGRSKSASWSDKASKPCRIESISVYDSPEFCPLSCSETNLHGSGIVMQSLERFHSKG